MTSRLLSFALTSLFALPACGGTVTSTPGNPPPDGGAAADTGTPSDDGGTHPDSGPGAPVGTSCPSAQPSVGGSCSGSMECEYGSDPDVDCDTLMTCASGTWVETQAAEACSTASSPECPASYANFDTSGENNCSLGETCVYPEERCSCARDCGLLGFVNPDGGVGVGWCCPDAPSGVPGCPSPRPRIGTACQGSLQCDYGACNGNVALECDGGVWVQTKMVACPG